MKILKLLRMRIGYRIAGRIPYAVHCGQCGEVSYNPKPPPHWMVPRWR